MRAYYVWAINGSVEYRLPENTGYEVGLKTNFRYLTFYIHFKQKFQSKCLTFVKLPSKFRCFVVKLNSRVKLIFISRRILQSKLQLFLSSEPTNLS